MEKKINYKGGKKKRKKIFLEETCKTDVLIEPWSFGGLQSIDPSCFYWQQSGVNLPTSDVSVSMSCVAVTREMASELLGLSCNNFLLYLCIVSR